MLHSPTRTLVALTDQLVVAATLSVGGATSPYTALGWLSEHSHGGLVRAAITVVSHVHAVSGTPDQRSPAAKVVEGDHQQAQETT